MLTRKGVLLLFGSIMLSLIGILIHEYQIIVLGIFFIIFMVLVRTNIPDDLQISRTASKLKVYEGDELDVALMVQGQPELEKNKKINLSNKLVELNDYLPGFTSLASDSNHKLFHLVPTKIRRVTYKLYCPLRGYYNLGPLSVRISDNFQLYYNETIMHNYHQFPVHIGYKTIKNFDLRTKAFDWNLGMNLLNIQGKSSDFYSLRDYTRQDSYREINWKATARKHKLMVNTYERETLSDCCIFIDSRDLCGLGRPHDNFIEHSVRLAFGLTKTIVNNNNRMSLVTYGDVVKIVPPGLGRNHTEYIHAMLINTQARGFLPFDHALSYAWPHLKPKSTVIIFTPLDFDYHLLPSLISLQRLAVKIIVVTSSLLTFESRALNKFTLRNELDSERRRMHIKELEKWGIKVISWEPEDNFEAILTRINIASGFRDIKEITN